MNTELLKESFIQCLYLLGIIFIIYIILSIIVSFIVSFKEQRRATKARNELLDKIKISVIDSINEENAKNNK